MTFTLYDAQIKLYVLYQKEFIAQKIQDMTLKMYRVALEPETFI
jgi:hypothetical protein